MATYTSDKNLWTVLVDGGSEYLIESPDIYMSISELNYGSFQTTYNIPIGSLITIKYQRKLNVFRGKVIKNRKISRSVDNLAKYEINIIEPAEELKYTYIQRENKRSVYLMGGDTNEIGFYVGEILYGTDWADVSENKDTVIESPSMGLSCSTVYSALQRLIVQGQNWGLWFDYNLKGSGTLSNKNIRYGPYNTNLGVSWPKPLDIKVEENTINYQVDGIIVYGDTKELSATAGSVGPEYKVVAYRLSQCQSLSELQATANKIYNQRKDIMSRYEIVFPAGWYDAQEGDKITIGDTSIGLDLASYGIKDIRITEDKTVVGIGAAEMTIFDILSDRLSVIDGDVLAYELSDFQTPFATVEVARNASSGAIDKLVCGPSYDFVFTIPEQTFVGELQISPKFSNSGADNTVKQTTLMIAAASATFDDTQGTITLLLDPDWFPWTWNWAEIELQYCFARGNTVGATAIWDCQWGDLDLDDDGSLQTSSSVKRTIIHKWIAPQSSNVQYAPIICTLAHLDGTPGDHVYLADVFLKLTVFYNTNSAEYELDTGDSDLQVWMRIHDPTYLETGLISFDKLPRTPWIKIFDSELQGASNYSSITYNISNDYNLDCTNFATGVHAIRVRAMGEIDCSISMVGKYLAFDEDTHIIQNT